MQRSTETLMVKSYESSVLPTIWTTAEVRLIHKNRRPKNLEELRTISLISIVGKLMEAVVQKMVNGLAEKFNSVRPYQVGFRKWRITMDVLAETQQRIHDWWARGM